MNVTEQKAIPVEKGQKTIGSWVAGIFAVLGLAFFIWGMWNAFANQAGRFDPSDIILIPVAATMVLAAIASLFLIRRGRHALGSSVLFYYLTLVPPIGLVLLLKGLASVTILYIVLLSTLLIFGVLPRNSRRTAIISAAIAVLLNLAIELWDPAFRSGTSLGDFASTTTILAVLAIFILLARQAYGGNILVKLVSSFVIITVAAVGVISSLSQSSFNRSLTENIVDKLGNLANFTGTEVATALDREFDILKTMSLNPDIQMAAQTANETNQLSQAEIDLLDQQWRDADAANNDSDPLVTGVL